MCGRYYLEEEAMAVLQQVVAKDKWGFDFLTYKKDIAPSDKVPVIIEKDRNITVELFTWGFQKYDKKGLIINARAETLTEKRIFKDCLYERRCIIPARGFYEWDSSKIKFKFTQDNHQILYMAGLYDEEKRVVIITTKANESMQPIHDRMPLILTEELMKSWLLEDKKVEEIIKSSSPMLNKHTDIEQMRLEFF